MRKVYNFSAGPAMLPEEVLLKAQAEMLDWNNTGMSIMELGHRGEEFQQLAKKSEMDLRELMQIPDDYQVLFLSGGATAQFAMVPLNLMQESKKADYFDTGIWSKKAITEASRYGDVNIVAGLSEINSLITIADKETWQFSDDADYVHYTPNETIAGIEFHNAPIVANKPLVADMTSFILSRPIDVRKFGVIYAGAQKNAGQAGITIVIIRNDLLKEPAFLVPTLYQYKLHAENHSCYNTPPTYAWYIAGLIFEWMKEKGGIKFFHELNQRKAKKLYDYIDNNHSFYFCRIHPSCRSMMNVLFDLRNEKLTEKFLATATDAGLTNLRGHRVAGGCRASIYNAMPIAAIDKLIEFMDDFAKKNA